MRPIAYLARVVRLLASIIVLAVLLAGGSAFGQSYQSTSTTYSWVDPSSHTNVTWSALGQCSGGSGSVTDDDATALISLGFTFSFGGTNYTSVRIASNGKIGFGTSIYCNDWNQNPYPDTLQNTTIRVYGLDLDGRASGTGGTTCPASTCYVRYASTGTSPNRRFIVSYVNVPEYNRAGSYVNLQLILQENGDFIMQYGASVSGSGYAAQRGYQLDSTDYSAIAGAIPASGTAVRYYMPDPTAEYRMEQGSWSGAGAVVDSSGNGNSGSALGSAQTTASGKVCRGATIPSNTNVATIDAVDTGMDVDTEIGSRSGMITFWYKSAASWNSSGSVDSQLFDATIANNTWFFLTKRANGDLQFVVRDTGSNTITAKVTGSFAANTWVHIAVSWNLTTTSANNNLRIYVNGALAVTQSVGTTNALNSGIGTLYFGDNRSSFTGANGTGNSANGIIDEFRIYAGTQGGVGIALRDMNSTRACTLSIGSFQINVGSASASTCAQKSITITALDTGGSTMTTYTGTINISTSTGSGDWALVSGSGTLTNGTSGDGSATYTFVAADNGVVTLGLTHMLAQQVTTTVVDNVTASTSTTSSTISFSDNTFVFTEDLSGKIAGTDVAVAGRAHDYQVALYRRDTSLSPANCSIATSYSGSKSLKAWLTRNASDPAGAAPAIGAVSLGNSQPASNNLSLTFTSGVATFNLTTTDVGKYAINFRDDTTTGLTAAITGSSNDLTVRPFAMVVSAIKRGTTNNPNANTATGTIFTQAGESFQATVGAYRHNAAADTNDDGLPDSGATLAQTTAGGLATSYAYATTLSAASAFTPTTGTLGTLSNGALIAGNFSGGSSTPTTLSYSEVGSFTLALAVTNYLGTSGVNLTGTTFNSSGAQNAVVGRFTPYDFGISLNTPNFTPGCSTNTAFTYIGQSFGFGTAPVITVTARNKSGGTTLNYTGSWWKITNASLTGRTYAAASGTLDTSGLPATTSDPTIVDLGGGSSGRGTLTFSAGTGLLFTRAAPVAPFNADISLAINVIDTDGIAYGSNPARFATATSGNGIAFSGTGGGKPMRWGRLKLTNVLGSEFVDLAMPLEAQYYNGTSFVANTDDGCTSFAKSSVQFSNFQRNLSACETFLSTTVASVTLSGGKGTLTLKKPGANNNGSVDLKPGLSSADSGTSCVSTTSTASAGTAAGVNLTWLRSNWDSTAPTAYDKNPTGRAVFGVPKVPRELIFHRENY